MYMMRVLFRNNINRLDRYLSSEVISFSLLLKIFLPIFCEQLFLACLSIFSIWLLSFDGENAMSVVSMMSVINSVFTSLCLGMVTGGTVIVAQNIGAKNTSYASRAMIQTIAFAVVLTAVLGAFLLWRKESLIGYLLAGANSEIISGAALYFSGFCISFPLYAFYQSFAGAMRGWGNSAIAWRLTLSVNIVQVTLTAVLLIALKMGVLGVAVAMICSRIFGVLYAVAIMIYKRKMFEINFINYLRTNTAILSNMLLIAIPLALEQFFFNSGKAFSQKFIAEYGTAHMAANGVVNAVFDIFNLPQISIREALVTVVGMCIGCGRHDLAKRYVYRFMRVIRKLTLYLMPITIPVSALLLYSYRLSPTAHYLAIWSIAIIFITGPVLVAGSLTIPAGLRAGGDAPFVSLAALGCMWGVRVTCSWLFAGVMGLGVIGLTIAMIMDWLARNVVFRRRLKGELWHSRKLVEKFAL